MNSKNSKRLDDLERRVRESLGLPTSVDTDEGTSPLDEFFRDVLREWGRPIPNKSGTDLKDHFYIELAKAIRAWKLGDRSDFAAALAAMKRVRGELCEQEAEG
jgi:hypothetical protein